MKYEATIDGQNQPDWIMYLTPGPKAHAEFALAHGRKPRKTLAAGAEGGEHQPRRRPVVSEQQTNTERIAMVPTFDPQLIAEFTRRGIAEQKATEILANLKPGQDVVAQLESAEQTVKALQNSQTPVRNPAGFYIRLIERNTPVPDGFETSAKRTARLERERKEREQRSVEEAKQQLEWEYDEYRDREIDRYIEANQITFDAMTDAKREEGRAKYSFTTESMAKLEARFEIRKQVPMLTFDEFLAQRKEGTDFSLKLVAVSPAAESPAVLSEPEVGNPDSAEMPVDRELAIEKAVQLTAGELKDVPQELADHAPPPVNSESPVLWSRDPVVAEDTITEAVAITSPVEDVAIDQVSPTVSAPPSASVERGEVSQADPDKPAPPPVSDPSIELAAEYPEAEPDSETYLV